MVRRCRYSITHPQSLPYNVSKDAALKIISSYLNSLLEKKKHVERKVEMEGEGVYDEMYNQEMYKQEVYKREVINHINLLQKVKDEISSTQNHNPLSVVAQHLQEVHQKRALISEAEGCLCLGISLLMRQQKVLLTKPEVMHQIDMLDKIFKEISSVQLPLTGGHQGKEVEEYQLPPLMMRMCDFRGFAEICEYRDFDATEVSLWRCKAVRNLKFMPSMNEMETKEIINRVELESLNKQRYLCVANGFEIFCLDLKRRKDQTFNNADDVPPLPKIAALQLSKELLQVASLGLFNWNSNAYMICGKVVNSISDDNPSDIYYRTIGKWAYLIEKLYEEGSACDIHSCSPADDGLTISHSEFNISKPNKPKFWPIVENIDGQIHLIDSLPKRVEGVCNVWTFSHEILVPESGTWFEITSPIESLLHINCHLVVGHHIFATSPVDLYFENQKRSYLVFDSKTKEWKPSQRHRHTYAIKDVWDILELGPARCAGEFPYGQPSDPLYVIIALEPDNTNYKDGMWAVAYLVTSMGQVLCIQVLRDFFAGPVWPCYMFEGKLIEVGGVSRTICSIVIASAWDRTGLEYVFVNTFTVEELTHVASQIRQLLAKGSKAWPVEQDFVRVDVKDNCIYKKNGGLEEEDSDRWVGVQACFL